MGFPTEMRHNLYENGNRPNICPVWEEINSVTKVDLCRKKVKSA